MTENKKYYYFTYIQKGDNMNIYNTSVTDEHPIDFVIKQKGKVILLCVTEITKEQRDRFAYAVRNN
jgi:hypothetical protein